MATPHAVLTHARHLFRSDSPAGRTTSSGSSGAATRRTVRARSGLLAGATAIVTIACLPGTAAAEPAKATSPQQATQLVSEASHRLEVVSEQLNTAKVQLDRQKAEVTKADKAAADAQKRLDALDDQIRELARTAYTSDGLNQLDVLLTSGSADEFVSQLGTLDAIAGHTNDVVTKVATASHAAEAARAKADEAAAKAQKTYDAISGQQADLKSKIADYKRQYARLSAAQQRQVVTAHAGRSVAVAPVAATVAGGSGAAQTAVRTALAQVGDPYVWGAAGPNAFDCSGLMQYAYSAAGISLPHSSGLQSQMGTPVPVSALQPGDLLFFYSPVSHVGMYIGNGQMVHASTSGSPVKVAPIQYMMSNFSGARRLG